jgi:hypothetical protein
MGYLGSSLRDVTFLAVIDSLHTATAINAGATRWAVSAWMQDNTQRLPHMRLSMEEAKKDAQDWADGAGPVDLEYFMLASTMKLAENGLMLHGKQIKRLIANLYKIMSPTERVAFKQWIAKEDGDAEASKAGI